MQLSSAAGEPPNGSAQDADPLVRHDIPGGAAWSLFARRGRRVSFTALGDGANLSTLIYAAGHPVDRLNVPDTLKAQMSACIRAPMVLMSDRGLALASLVRSTLSWHDALGGHSVDAHVAAFGPSSYAGDRNEWRRSARAGLLSELRKSGRDGSDLHACINFFSKVSIGGEPDAPLQLTPGHSVAGDVVELRAEQDLLLVLSTAAHPLATVWAPAAVRVEVAPGEPAGPQDAARTFRPESGRALAATEQVFA